MERLYDGLYGIAHYLFVAMAGGIAWLVRTVLTNQKQIALLQQDITSRDKQRAEDREALSDVRESVKRIEGWIMERGK